MAWLSIAVAHNLSTPQYVPTLSMHRVSQYTSHSLTIVDVIIVPGLTVLIPAERVLAPMTPVLPLPASTPITQDNKDNNRNNNTSENNKNNNDKDNNNSQEKDADKTKRSAWRASAAMTRASFMKDPDALTNSHDFTAGRTSGGNSPVASRSKNASMDKSPAGRW